jgi:predicted nucleic acid-binding protein
VRLALDTNILAYAEGVNGASLKRAAIDLIERLPEDRTVLPVQILGELFHVLVRKAGQTRAHARAAVLNWRDAFPVVETSAAILASAMDLAADHQLGIWDAVVVSAAAAANCRLLLSEDLQEGFTWSGITVVNPFSPSPHPRLDGLLRDAS